MHFSNHPRLTLKKENTGMCYDACIGCLQSLFNDFFFYFYGKDYLRKNPYIFNIDPDVASIAAR